MCTIYNLMGYSDSGKDTVAGIIQEYERAINVKWSRPMKDMLEMVYSIPKGSLDDKEFRKQIVPGHTINWSELMIRCYFQFPEIDPNMMIQKTIRKIKYSLIAGTSVIITDTRNITEGDTIKTLLNNSCGLVNIWLHRPGISPKASDKVQPHIYQSLAEHTKHNYTVINDGTLEQLTSKIEAILCNH